MAARARPSSPNRARITGYPIKPLLQKVQQIIHMPRPLSLTRKSRERGMHKAAEPRKMHNPTRKMMALSRRKAASKGRSMAVNKVAGKVTFISRAVK